MNSVFKKRQITFLIQLLIISLLLYAVHSYILYYFANGTSLFFPLWQIYTFLIIVTLLLYSVINYRVSKGKTEIFNGFMISTFLKMILAIVFLSPLLLSNEVNKQPDVFNFFIPYFLYLFFEVYSITIFLQKKH
jgi:phosphatidylglycerophosphate synthase